MTRDGLNLRLTLPHGSYPRNALVRVWAEAKNVSRRAVWIYDSGPPAPGKAFPQPEVFNASGTRMLPLSIVHYSPYPGPLPTRFLFQPGQVRRGWQVIVLRGPLLRLSVRLAENTRKWRMGLPSGEVSTPAVRVRLTAPDTPSVYLHVSPGTLSADIIPGFQTTDQPLSVSSTECGIQVNQNIYWTPDSRHITPACVPIRQVQSWRVVIGWLGHSVATIDYTVR